MKKLFLSILAGGFLFAGLANAASSYSISQRVNALYYGTKPAEKIKIVPVSNKSANQTNYYREPRQSSMSNYYNYLRQSLARKYNLNTEQPTDLSVTVSPIRSKKDMNIFDNVERSLFEISLKNVSSQPLNTYTEALKVKKLHFKVTENNGVAADPSDFALVVNEKIFPFEKDGTLTLTINNLRLARNESLGLGVGLRFTQSSKTSNIPGYFKVNFVGVDAEKENSPYSKVETRISGTKISQLVRIDSVINPTLDPGYVYASPTQIYGKTLISNEKASVLGLNLQASYDDLRVEKITIKNILSGNAVDSYVRRVRVINSNSGYVYGTGNFVNGEASIYLSEPIFIGRNNSVSVAVEVEIGDLSNNSQATSFKLNVAPSDIQIQSVSNGKYLTDINKKVTVNSQTFTVSSATITIKSSEKQPTLTTMSEVLPVYYFEVTNPGKKSIELGRISLSTGIKGVEINGGVNPNSVKIARVVDGGMIYGTNFELVSSNLDKLVFDASSPISVRGKSVAKFALLMNLKDITGNPDADYVHTKILSDGEPAKGTLTELRSSGYNFVWSDITASPHSEGSRDWISGYLLSGLPTGLEFSKR